MNIYVAIIIFCWAIFMVVWGVGALTAKRSKNRPWRYLAIRAAIAFGLAFVLATNSGHVKMSAYTPPNPALAILGVACVALGTALAIWARLYLGRNWGMPMTQKADSELVTSGPYAYIRHPIYSGVLLAILGSTAAAGPMWFVVLAVVAVYFIYSATQEEKTMLKTFPDTYPAYKSRTNMLIPFIL
jgi:protein-S-isoprenylcysteine O-methyltransferase Ste14